MAEESQNGDDLLKQEVEKIIWDDIPETITKLIDMLDLPILNHSNEEISQELQLPIEDNTNTNNEMIMIPNNSIIDELHKILRPLLIKQVEQSNMLTMWLTSLIPEASFDNFEVRVIKNAIGLVKGVKRHSSRAYTQFVTTFNKQRGDAIKNILKFPFNKDSRQLLSQLDENHYFNLCTMAKEILNKYLYLHDYLEKNKLMLKAPTSRNNIDTIFM